MSVRSRRLTDPPPGARITRAVNNRKYTPACANMHQRSDVNRSKRVADVSCWLFHADPENICDAQIKRRFNGN